MCISCFVHCCAYWGSQLHSGAYIRQAQWCLSCFMRHLQPGVTSLARIVSGAISYSALLQVCFKWWPSWNRPGRHTWPPFSACARQYSRRQWLQRTTSSFCSALSSHAVPWQVQLPRWGRPQSSMHTHGLATACLHTTQQKHTITRHIICVRLV